MSVTLRLWGGKLVHAHVLRRRFGFLLLGWRVRESWDGDPPFSFYYRTSWRPAWRTFPVGADRPTEGGA